MWGWAFAYESLRVSTKTGQSQVSSLIDEIRLIPEDGHLRIEVRGELGAILRLAAGARHAKGADLLIDALSEQVKVVAGTGFEPVTFRL